MTDDLDPDLDLERERERDKTEKVYGRKAARAVLEKRPDDVLKIAYVEALRMPLREHLRAAAARRAGYEEKSAEEIGLIAGSPHHEGICLKVRPRVVLWDLEAADTFTRAEGKVRLVALDGVENPHNVGGIARTAAFFGIDGLIVEEATLLTPAAVRVAEGGLEHLELVRSRGLARLLGVFASSGFAIVGTDGKARDDARRLRYPERAIVVLGAEAGGMSDEVRRTLTHTVGIRGVGTVESLNVSVAAGIVLASMG
jgi:TrmH RNA methyltransferase